MSFDFETKISAKLINDKTIVLNPKMKIFLTERGFGESDKDSLILDSFETLYLLYNEKLELKKVNKNVVFDELIQKYIQKNDDTLIRFLLYRDLRTKGYVVKDGFGFDSDFRVYERGTYGLKEARFVIFAFNECNCSVLFLNSGEPSNPSISICCILY